MGSSAAETRESLHRLATAIGGIPTQAMVATQNTRSLPVMPADLTRRDEIIAALMMVPPLERFHAIWGKTWIEVLQQTGLIDDYWRPSRGVFCKATDGTWMRSLAEKSVDDFLSAHGIAHEHEPSWPHDDDLNPSGRRRADWRLDDGTYVEYAGLMTEANYARKMLEKQQLAAKTGVPLIVLTYEDLLRLPERFSAWLGAPH